MAINKAKSTTIDRDSAIKGSTRLVGIIGDPISHTLSPRMHNAAFAELGLDYAYVPLQANGLRIKDVVRSIAALGFAGINVTVPFKEKVLRYLDRTTADAAAIGAVNTIVNDGRHLIGYNTDAEGFRLALVGAGLRLRGKRVLVVGAGGSARAVVYALAQAGASDIVIANRTISKARKLATTFGKRPGVLRAADLEVLDDIDLLSDRQLVVNCTPLGLKGSSFFDYAVESTPEDCLHFDLTYGTQPTPFLRAAAAAKRPVLDGRHMLAHQGALAFKLFTGRRAPIDTMLAAIGIE
jgi:shikimate dehydrogenase